MDEIAEKNRSEFLHVVITSVACLWFGLLAFFIGFVLVDAAGWLEFRRMGNVPDAPPPGFPQWVAWAIPAILGIAGAIAGAKLAGLLVRRIRQVGR
jgi:hypothetical protein